MAEEYTIKREKIMKKVLLFGTGFIATNLIEYFKSKSIECVILYNQHRIEAHPDIKHYSMDNDIENIFKIEKPDYGIILHGNSFVSDNINIENSVNSNVLKSASFLEQLYEKKLYLHLKKIIIVGSASEYGKFYDKPIKENFELHPTSIYGLSKIFLYNTAKYFVEKGLPILYIRQFNTIGVGQRESFVLSSFAKNIVLVENKMSEPVLNVGDLTQERDFIDIRDTCTAYNLLMEKGIIGEVYNVASGEYVSIEFLLSKTIEHSNLNKNELTVNANANLFSKEVSLSKRLHANIEKITELGFKRKYILEETVKDTLEYWRRNV